MVGPFKRSKDKKTHLLVAVDKFMKWVEVEPVSKCDAATAVQFIKKVIFRFGFPHSIITDNGTNLSKGAMKEFCQREHIRLCRRYALEAIINVIDYLPVHNYVYVPCYNCCGSRARISIKALGRTHMHVWNNKR